MQRVGDTHTEYCTLRALSGIETLGAQCFYGFTALTEVEIATTVHRIEGHVFDNSKVAYFRVHANLKYIHPGAFNNDVYLTHIDVDEQTTEYTAVDGMLLTKDTRDHSTRLGHLHNSRKRRNSLVVR